MDVLFEELSAPKRAGGIEAATSELAWQLNIVGISVFRCSGEAGGQEHAAAPTTDKLTLARAVGGRPNARRRVRANDDKLVQVQPDCVHVHGLWSPSLVKRALVWKRRGVPCLVSTHGMLEPWALQHKRFKKEIAWRLYQKWLLQGAGALHATAAKESTQFRTLGLTTPAAVIPWGISTPPGGLETIESTGPRAQAGNRTADSGGRRTALFVGRISPVKGLPMLVEAWSRVKPEGWTMRIVGPDQAGHRAEVEALIRERGLTRDFEFAGELTGHRKEQAYAGADLFILPSHTENFGMAIGEALAHGLPVIATKGAPWGELETRHCGWWVAIGVDGLAEALALAAKLSEAERSEMGARGRQLVEERYSWPQIAANFKGLYAWLAGRGERPEFVEL